MNKKLAVLTGLECAKKHHLCHTSFVDDSLIHMNIYLLNATSLQRGLDTYCAKSGQLVIIAKSSIFFSPHTSNVAGTKICNELHIDMEALSDIYLGLPALVGVNRGACFKRKWTKIVKKIVDGRRRSYLIVAKKLC